MGCTHFKSGQKVVKIDPVCMKAKQNIPYLTDMEKVVIQNNWQGLKLHIANIGVMTYTSMFESHPELIKTFSTFESKDVNKLQESGLLQKHALRVMSTIDTCITHINESSSMKNILQEVGERHKMHSVNSNDIQVILPHFLTAMKPYSQDPWSKELQDVWTRFLSFIVYHIRLFMQENEHGGSTDKMKNKDIEMHEKTA